MVRICPKCSYIRKPEDEAPEWQCPSCQVAYCKAGGPEAPSNYGRYGAPTIVTKSEASSSGILKWVLILITAVALVWVTKPTWQKKKAAAPVAALSGQPDITLYSASWCGYCDKTREFFDANGIRYTELDVEKTTAGYEGHRKLGGKGIPVTVVGEEVIRGYSEERFRHELKPWLKGS
jgi:glutaredoxin